MALQKGKRKRRYRRQRSASGFDQDMPRQVSIPKAASQSSAASSRRRGKPLAERSPVFPALICLLCIAGALFAVKTYKINDGTIALLVLYVVLAIVHAGLAVMIVRAKGSWR